MRTKPNALPAKLSPPRLQNAVTRERLFKWLDHARADHAAVWMGGVPGAGKTTLVASYLQARALACVWYRFDADDNDLGRVFSLLGQAVDALSPKLQKPKAQKRPAFDVDHARTPRAFAQAWFRHVFAMLPRRMVLVFDNLEHANLHSLPELLACAIDELPDGITLLLTSRNAPPPMLASARMKGTLAVLDEALLQFTTAESADYARAFSLDPSLVAAAALRSNGWAGGLRLLGSGSSGDNADSSATHAADAPLLFDYFAELVRANVDDAGHHMLRVAALLPSIPLALLLTLSDVADAEQRLNTLCANNFFIERVAHSANTYRLHPLLRAYLLEQGRRDLEPHTRQRLLRAAAEGFVALGEIDAAIDLGIDGDDWDHVVALLLTVFEAKLALGQLDQLEAWTKRLPSSIIDREAQLRYCLARLCFFREDENTVSHYEKACDLFAMRGELFGQQLCAAGLLEWSYHTARFVDGERCSQLLKQRFTRPLNDSKSNEQYSLRLFNGRLLASFFDGGFDADAKRWIADVLALMVPGDADNEKLSTASTLYGCLERRKHWDEAQFLAGKMATMLQSPSISMRLKLLARQQIFLDLPRQTGDYASVRLHAPKIRALATENAFPETAFDAVAALLGAALCTGDEREARVLLVELSLMSEALPNRHSRLIALMHTWCELQCGHLVNAEEYADALRAEVARSEVPARFRGAWLAPAVYVRFAAGERDGACAELAQLVADVEPGSRQHLEANLYCLEASRHLQAGRAADAETMLTRAWPLVAESRNYGVLAPLRKQLSDLCALALERGILPDFTCELITRRRLRPPSIATEHWPWPVQIQTFGQFAIRIDRVPMHFNGKVPKKPLALLKALIAHGVQDVPEHVLTDALWPDEDADAAHDAFNVALHRLRKLIPNGADIIRLQEGRLSLDRDLCWIDCRAFEHSVAAVDDALADGIDALPALPSLQKALNLYRGRFLSEDRDEPWSLSARERMRSKFNRIVVNCARALSAAGREAEALACYQRGIETDDLAEAFYLGAMQCTLALKRPADGLALYQRLERMLAIALSIKPSTASQLLRRQLLES